MSTRRPAFASVSTSTTSHVAGEKGREREHIALLSDGVCVCVLIEKKKGVGLFEKRERDREREREREYSVVVFEKGRERKRE